MKLSAIRRRALSGFLLLSASVALFCISIGYSSGTDLNTEESADRESRLWPYSAVASDRRTTSPIAPDIPKVIGGESARPGQFPWHAALIRADASEADPFKGYFCGGTLIRWRWILTAAHCLYYDNSRAREPVLLHPSQIHVYLGSVNFVGGERIRVARIKTHTKYDYHSSDNDIALLELQSEPANKEQLALLNLISENELDLEDIGQRAIVAGWGSTEPGEVLIADREAVRELKFVNGIKLRDRGECNRHYVEYRRERLAKGLLDRGRTRSETIEIVDAELPTNTTLVTENMICAGSPIDDQDTCFGDSGGALLVRRDQIKQVGLVSWGPGNGCGLTNVYGVYSRVSRYLDWLRSEMRD